MRHQRAKNDKRPGQVEGVISPRNSGVPSGAASNPPPSRLASSPSATATGSRGSAPASGRHSRAASPDPRPRHGLCPGRGPGLTTPRPPPRAPVRRRHAAGQQAGRHTPDLYERIYSDAQDGFESLQSIPWEGQLMTADFSLSNGVALVTGAASGIGRAIALGLADVGALVGCVDQVPGTVEATAAEIVAAGSRAVPVVARVTAPAA